jgi:hypothetical protein
VDHALLVQVAKRKDKLRPNELNSRLLEPLQFENVVIQIASWQKLEEEVDPQFVLKNEIHGVDERVVCLEENVFFILNVLDLFFL